jgi:hypothetical protein
MSGLSSHARMGISISEGKEFVGTWGGEDWVNQALGLMKTDFADKGIPVSSRGIRHAVRFEERADSDLLGRRTYE